MAGVVLAAAAAAAVATRDSWSPLVAKAQAPASPPPARVVTVDVATAVKKPVPVKVEALGNVTPIASVALKSRLETTIKEVHFADGALVKAGDLLFTLDSRAIEAQIKQAEGVLARDQAQFEGAERDVRRYTELVAKNATPITNLDNAKTQTAIYGAAIKASEAVLENLKVQLSYCTIRAPIPGRISVASVKAGNFVRPADVAPLATINQMAPIYVAFSVPQRVLVETRQAVDAKTAKVDAFVPGEREPVTGRLTMFDNTVDSTTGMVTIRATMENGDEMLWPGSLVNVALTLRDEEAITIPSVAVQTGQKGSYVFVIKNGTAEVRPVTVARTVGTIAVIAKGVEAGEVVVTDGQLLLANGTKVNVREPKAGA